METFIASGNVVFSSEAPDADKLHAIIDRHLEASLGYRVDTFVRTTDEVAAIARTKICAEDGEEGVTIHVGFMREILPDLARKLMAVRTAEDKFRVIGREYYWLCRTRVSDSKVWRLAEMKSLRLPTSTMRNINTIRKLTARFVD